jgi:hypothetical protein
MGAFDAGWWDARTLSKGDVDTTSGPGTESERGSWIRWRLIDDLIDRFYVDLGLEAGFGAIGVELYQVVVSSPNCRRSPRYFGRLCGNHVHTERERLVEGGPWPLDYAATARSDAVEAGTWHNWGSYRKEAIATLGLDRASVAGHERCFHRRGKSLYQVMWRVGLAIAHQSGGGLPRSQSQRFHHGFVPPAPHGFSGGCAPGDRGHDCLVWGRRGPGAAAVLRREAKRRTLGRFAD